MNYATDKLIIMRYPGSCGGKFLINSLGLSNDAVFQHAWYAEQQLIGKFTPTDKLQYLLTEIKDVYTGWTDLNLGCFQMFGIFTENQTLDAEWDPILSEVIDSGKYFFIVAHGTEDYNRIKGIWTGASSVQFINCPNFIRTARLEGRVLKYAAVDDEPEHTWNAEWFLDEDATILHIKDLYQKLNLSDFNESYVRQLFRMWRDKIKTSTVYY